MRRFKNTKVLKKVKKHMTCAGIAVLMAVVTMQFTGCGNTTAANETNQEVQQNTQEVTEAFSQKGTAEDVTTKESEESKESKEKSEETSEKLLEESDESRAQEDTLAAEEQSTEKDSEAQTGTNTEVAVEMRTEPAQTQPVTEAETAPPETEPETQEQTEQQKQGITICIDPGHGGDSNGTRETYDGVEICEKDLNYRIATSLKNYLEQYGVNVILTHSADSDLSLAGRMDYAASARADYFISVHVNSRSTDEVDSTGCMVLMSCSHYQPDNAAVSSLYDTEYALATSIISRLNGLGLPIANDWNVENTGGILQRENTVGETYPDGSQADYYGILYNGTYAGIPSIIVEHAFLSNENDYRNYLSSGEKLDGLARADAEGIADALSLR